MNPRNPLWREAPALNAYITRCQSVLQAGRPDNDLLVYWPIHDLYAAGHTYQFSVHDHRWLSDEPLGRTARALWEAGVAFDYVSDRLLDGIHAGPGGTLVAPGGASYRAVLVPSCRTMPDATLARLLALAADGATVIFEDALPADVPGLGRLEARRAAFRKLSDSLGAAAREAGALCDVRHGKGRVLAGPRVAALAAAGISGEAVAQHAGAQRIAGLWSVEFIVGGPVLPKPCTVSNLASWTRNGDPASEAFAGTARYRTKFEVSGVGVQVSGRASGTGSSLKPDTRHLTPLLLDLGDVRHVARVRINGRDLGTAFMRPYRVEVPADLLKPSGNELEIEVTNLAANRIRDLDRRKVEWRIFRDINLVSITYKPFDASGWPVFESGLLGPVVLRQAE